MSFTPETLQRAIKSTEDRLLTLLREKPTPSIAHAILFEIDRLSTLRAWAAAQETPSIL